MADQTTAGEHVDWGAHCDHMEVADENSEIAAVAADHTVVVGVVVDVVVG